MTGSASGGEQARRMKSTLLDCPGEFRWREGGLLVAADPSIGSNRPFVACRHGSFSRILPILYGRDDRQRSNLGGVPFVCGPELLTDRQCADI